ncbi:uncharacterized protein LOC127123288 [Lathyrus oleraceus]|uniref:uncharacterized protein LOC127123288 n=1 Tax=Pisum sativum TaxID=3888 RepID=UPI0021CFF83F|nr:uncharacterized protein LOC127123288 [Pisum sativum]
MVQLADRVRQVERLKAENSRTSRFRKKKVAYVKVDNIENSSDSEYEYVEENKFNMDELNPDPPYTCKLLKPSNVKNPIEPKNEKFVARTSTFDVTKCDEIFDLLVVDGQIVVPKGNKVMPLEQRKELVQNSLKDDRLQFVNKQKLCLEEETKTKGKALFVELVDIMVVDTVGNDVAKDSRPNNED